MLLINIADVKRIEKTIYNWEKHGRYKIGKFL